MPEEKENRQQKYVYSKCIIRYAAVEKSSTIVGGKKTSAQELYSRSLAGINKVALTPDTQASRLPKNTPDSLAMAFVCNPHCSRRWKISY